MIRKANLLLSKAEPVCLEETARLKQLKAQNDEVLRQELAQRATLVEIEVRLAQTASFNEAELRSQALIRAAEERKTRLATLKDRSSPMKRHCSLQSVHSCIPLLESIKSDFILTPPLYFQLVLSSEFLLSSCIAAI